MKTFRFSVTALLVALVSLAFVGCGNDDEPEVAKEIYGKWKCVYQSGPTNYVDEGKGFVFWDASINFKAPDGETYKVKKCMNFDLDNVNNISIADWDDKYYPGDSYDIFFAAYQIKGDELCIMNNWLDSYVGKVEIDGDQMTWTCISGYYFTPGDSEVKVCKFVRL